VISPLRSRICNGCHRQYVYSLLSTSGRRVVFGFCDACVRKLAVTRTGPARRIGFKTPWRRYGDVLGLVRAQLIYFVCICGASLLAMGAGAAAESGVC
jgi:hypothetical protein